MKARLISLFEHVGLLITDMLADNDIKTLALTSTLFRAFLLQSRSIRQLRICRKLKEPCDIFEALEFLRKNPGERLGLCLLSLASQIPLLMVKPVCGPDNETESSANGDILAPLKMNLKIKPPLSFPEQALLSELPQCVEDPKLLQNILIRIRNVLFQNRAREHFRCQLVDMEKNSPFRGPVRKLIRLILLSWAKFKLIKFADEWTETQPQPNEENMKILRFLQKFKDSLLPDWGLLPVQAADEGCVPMHTVIRHLVCHRQEGFRLFDTLDFRQGQREFVGKVMHVVQMMDPVNPFNQLVHPDFQRAIYEFLKAYGTSGRLEITDPRGENWDRGKSSLLFWDFLMDIRQARKSKRLKLEGHDRREFDKGMKTLHGPRMAMKRAIGNAVIKASHVIAGHILHDGNYEVEEDEKDEEDA